MSAGVRAQASPRPCYNFNGGHSCGPDTSRKEVAEMEKYTVGWQSGSTYGTCEVATLREARSYGYQVARGNSSPGDSYGYTVVLTADYDEEGDICPVVAKNFRRGV